MNLQKKQSALELDTAPNEANRKATTAARLDCAGTLRDHVKWIEYLVAKGGPSKVEYPAFSAWLNQIHQMVQAGLITRTDLTELRRAFGEVLTTRTLQGFAFEKPHGYAGDFEMIDRIYRFEAADDPQLQRWDEYNHSIAATH
ncbi:MAG: hypothetical protein M3Y86_10390, partial [Verrucomicrobiota bacterium]|nr:hypothetical protein [Verrucomicrobiota bacterium]